MFNVGPMELLVILMVALIVVGPKRLPEIGRTIGKSLREFRRATDEVRYSFQADLDDERPAYDIPDGKASSTRAKEAAEAAKPGEAEDAEGGDEAEAPPDEAKGGSPSPEGADAPTHPDAG